MDNTYICEQTFVFRRHTNNLKKWRDNDHISHILFNLFRDLYDSETRNVNKLCCFFKQINNNPLLSFAPPAYRQRGISSELHYRKKIIT
ncbi:hypothetical protein FNI11_18775 [Salmonella enterica subsp. salamae]|nr:hypothetical protein [Salmonella enterica subsp. salamae]ECJ2282667.1 hypothetical protein [Salmonella enterica subsp. salamae]